MAATITPLRPGPLRTAETSRPKSGTRLRSAPAIPPPPLSVVERRSAEHFPCAQKGCTQDGREPSLIPFGNTTLVVLLCEACTVELAAVGARPVPFAKEGR